MRWKKFGAATALTLSLGTGGTIAADNAINPYDDKGTTLEIVAESTIPEAGEIRTELAKDRPAVTLSKWDGEAAMTVSYDKVKGQGSRAFLTNKMEWKDGAQEVHAYPLEAKAGMEDGGFEIEVILNEKPDSNVFEFPIEGAEELEFFYQAPLWQQNGLHAPQANCTDTLCSIDRDGGISSMPENVVGSFAVYHSTNANAKADQRNYATGKVYHIYRPKAVDAAGREIWGILTYADQRLSVTLDATWLGAATYPVTVDPTFGVTSVGGTEVSGITNSTNDIGQTTGTYTASSGDIVTLYSVYSRCNAAGTGYIDMASYTFVASKPNTRLAAATTITFSNTTSAWRDSSAVSDALSAGTAYTLAVGNYTNGSGACNVSLFRDTPGGTQNSQNASGALPATWTETTSSGSKYSFYATYTASGGGAATYDDTDFFLINN